MDSLFGAEGSLIVRFVVAFVIVLALIGLTFWLIRRFGTARVGNAAQRGRQPRLAVIDAAPVDGRRRLVLVRRDNVEHLLMIGGPSDFVVEQNIVRAVPVNPPRDVPVPRAEAARTPETARPQPFDDDAWTPPPPEPPRSAFSRPDPLARAPRPEPRPFAAEPLVRAPLPPGIAARPVEPPPIVPSAEPAPDAALASMAQRLEAALRRPGGPEAAAAPQSPAPPHELGNGEATPPTAPDDPARATDQKGGKPKTVLDSLEEEMASLLGRPSEKQ
ncbi:MAG: flagellar biosynthesis protein FliO [Alphaproteobacteria bacterium]|nr:MAG: flagellar biosynthesis protein FliO [Alphaproteobacteria bacterium]